MSSTDFICWILICPVILGNFLAFAIYIARNSIFAVIDFHFIAFIFEYVLWFYVISLHLLFTLHVTLFRSDWFSFYSFHIWKNIATCLFFVNSVHMLHWMLLHLATFCLRCLLLKIDVLVNLDVLLWLTLFRFDQSVNSSHHCMILILIFYKNLISWKFDAI